MWLVSVISLAILVVVCAIGVFHNWYDDNLPQRIGMGCVAVGYGSFQVEYQTLAHVGMALFAVGTAYKVWKYKARPPKAKPPPSHSAHPPWWEVKR